MKYQKKAIDNHLFLPVSKEDLSWRGWDSCDFIFVSGDAYVDHPSFAAALICRVLEAAGFRVGIIPQPRWEDPTSYLVLGLPRLAFLVGAGNLDSMVAHYTANKKPRSQDVYSPGGKTGCRPDRATLVYVEGLRRACKLVGEHRPIIIGGIEASLRRFAHYDYWSDKIRRSILLDSKADLLVYGMGERPILEIARRISQGEPVESIRDVRGTCVWGHGVPQVDPEKVIELPSFEEIREPTAEAKRRFAEHFMLQKRNQDPLSGKILVEKSDTRYVLQNPPALPLATAELDRIYELPFTREAHPMYAEEGGVPALQEVAFSLVSSRGCFGGCSFCAITFHQGRIIQHRSKESLLREAQTLVRHSDFKGYIHDVGGPTANFFSLPCEVQKRGGVCTHRDCLYPASCPNLRASHREYREVLQALRSLPGIKKVFVRSGLRFDYLLLDTTEGPAFFKELCAHHVSGQLKVAPEHVSPRVLDAMGKTGSQVYEEFRGLFAKVNGELGKKQYLIPYFIASHPGSTLEDALELALYLKKTGFVPDQVQDFYPTPGSLATVMYYTGLDPRTMKAIPVPRGERDRRLQRALLQFNKKENHPLVKDALKQLGKLHLSRTLGLGEHKG